MRLAHLKVLPENVLTRNCQYESDIVHAPAAPGASFSVSRITRRELRDHNPALTNAIVRPRNYLTECLRNWLCHCVKPDRATFAKEPCGAAHLDLNRRFRGPFGGRC